MTNKNSIEECKFCHEPYELMIDEAGWKMFLDENEYDGHEYLDLVMTTGRGFASTPANYCPKCGRKLF